MSDNQFQLYRQTNAVGKQTNTFLDLEVLDISTGKRRPVGNLSGGESFKASLSLALGLSDTIAENRGGIQMDALFVDEGLVRWIRSRWRRQRMRYSACQEKISWSASSATGMN